MQEHIENLVSGWEAMHTPEDGLKAWKHPSDWRYLSIAGDAIRLYERVDCPASTVILITNDRLLVNGKESDLETCKGLIAKFVN